MEPCILDIQSIEFIRLDNFRKMLNKVSPNNHIYTIIDCYNDVGTNVKWTTIIDNTADCQILSNRNWTDIVEDNKSINELLNIILFDNMYSQDKAK